MTIVAGQKAFGQPGDRELYVENLHVYREWRFGELGPHLIGLNKPVLWSQDEWTTARCLKEGLVACDQAPTDTCACGLYGWYEPGRRWEGPPAFFGVAEVSGTCVLGSIGLRAQRMKPIGILVTPRGARCFCGCGNVSSASETSDQSDLIAAAMKRSLPGVGVFRSIDDLVAKHPPSDWESIVGPIPDHLSEPSWATQLSLMRAAAAQIGRQYTFSIGVPAAQFARLAAAGLAPAPEAPSEDPPKQSPAEKSLEARRNRGTGPARKPPWLLR